MHFISNNNRLLQGGVVYTGYSGGDMWVSGLEYSGDKITGYSGSAFGGSAECPCDSAAIVDSAYDKTTAWVNDQEFITAHQDVSNLPYVQNSALDYNGLMISSISGDSIYALSAENAFTAEFAYNSQMADSAQTAIYAQSANSALHAEYSNVAYTALSSNNLVGLEFNASGEITGFNGSAFAGNSTIEYSAGDNINITDNVISGKYWTDEITAASSYAYEQATGSIPAVQEYSAGDNINITNHVVSGKSWANDITAASAYAYEQATAQIPSILTGSYVENSALDYTDNGLISAISSHNLYAVSSNGTLYAETANLANSASVAASATYDSNGNVITATYLTAITGDTIEYSAGPNISINNHTISGKNWTTDIQNASAYVYGQVTGQIPGGAYVENSALKLTGNNVTGISSYNVGAPQVPVTGSGSVTVTSGNNQVIIYGESVGGTASIFTGGTYSDKEISSINFKQAGGSDAELIGFNYSGGSISSQLIPMTTEAGFLYCPGIGRRITTAHPDYKYVPITTASAGAIIYITSYPNEVITFVTMGDNVNTGVDTTATIVGPFASITMESGMWVTFSRYFTQSHGLTYAQLGSGWIGGNYI